MCCRVTWKYKSGHQTFHYQDNSDTEIFISRKTLCLSLFHTIKIYIYNEIKVGCLGSHVLCNHHLTDTFTKQKCSQCSEPKWLDDHTLRVSCQKGPTRHAYAWQIGPFWQDTLDICNVFSYWLKPSSAIYRKQAQDSNPTNGCQVPWPIQQATGLDA